MLMGRWWLWSPFISKMGSFLCKSSAAVSPIFGYRLTAPNLFITGLSRLTNDEKLKEAFSSFGQVIQAKVITERSSGRSKGYGFVTYASIEDAEKAKQEMNGKFLDGWVIFVDPAKPREYRPPPQSRQPSSKDGLRSSRNVGWFV